MNADQSQVQQAEALHTLTTYSLSSSISELSGSSRAIPSGKDFHFFYNFDEFKSPIQELTRYSESMLETIGSSTSIWGKEIAYPQDLDDAYDWLVTVNDEIFERFDVSVDEFQRIRKSEEESGKPIMDLDDGFQLVYGKKKNKGGSSDLLGDSVKGKEDLTVKVATRDKKVTTKPKVPFHIPAIRKPQEEFKILVNNVNQPFEHVWLERSEDGQRFIHPLEKLSVVDFVDKDIMIEPRKPPSTESTPFKLVEEVKDLKDLAAKLRGVDEFAVDLEHNQYRSFQGLTCLMQISTRTEDFVVDTLKLRIHVGPYLREIFKDPTKKKVMHGADHDIIWLQRDFGIYVCNLFDTGQASRVLKLDRNSLEFLLHHFCGITANKEYQNAEWRLRPLPAEMLRYAREDTHYLLYIYDLMRQMLLSMPKESGSHDSPLVEVYKRSYDVCMQLYEKELLTENSYLYIYGLQGAGFNSQQVAVAAGLFEWRDVVARAEDESTGYILPNKTLLEIAKQIPLTTGKLRRLVKSRHPYIERNLASVVSIIRNSLQNAAAFEVAAELLKEGRMKTPPVENTVNNDCAEVGSLDSSSNLRNATDVAESIDGGRKLNGIVSALSSFPLHHKEEMLEYENCNILCQDAEGDSSKHPVETGKVETVSGVYIFEDAAERDTGATIQALKKPCSAFGALLGNTAPKKKLNTIERIKLSVNLPFNSFLGKTVLSESSVEGATKALEIQQHTEEERPVNPAYIPKSEDVIMLEDHSNVEESICGNSESKKEWIENNSSGSALEVDSSEPMSLSDLSSSFQKCFDSSKQRKKVESVERFEADQLLQLNPFNYEAAREQVTFGEQKEDSRAERDRDGRNRVHSGGKKKSSAVHRVQLNNETTDFVPGKRRHAFPATGNRSATFR